MAFCSELPASTSFSESQVADSGNVLHNSTVSRGFLDSVTKPPNRRKVSESATAYETVISSPGSKSLLATSSTPSGLFFSCSCSDGASSCCDVVFKFIPSISFFFFSL